ncbi:DUF2283 domain-containing protein [Methanosphaera sp.]
MVKYDIYTYDEEIDALFLTFPVEYEFQQVLELEDDILLEIDTNGKHRALEILNASMHFKSEKSILKNNITNMEMTIRITDNDIIINIYLTDSNKQKSGSLNKISSNSYSIPVSEEYMSISLD